MTSAVEAPARTSSTSASSPVRSLPPAQWNTTPPGGAEAIARTAATTGSGCSVSMAGKYSGVARLSMADHRWWNGLPSGSCGVDGGEAGRPRSVVRGDLLGVAEVDHRADAVGPHCRPTSRGQLRGRLHPDDRSRPDASQVAEVARVDASGPGDFARSDHVVQTPCGGARCGAGALIPGSQTVRFLRSSPGRQATMGVGKVSVKAPCRCGGGYGASGPESIGRSSKRGN